MADEPLVVRGTDHRSQMYERIAVVHKQIVEAKWRSKTAGGQFSVKPEIILHLEKSVAFLAEELLELRSIVENPPTQLEKTQKILEGDHAPV
jgi:hypothetical protein